LDWILRIKVPAGVTKEAGVRVWENDKIAIKKMQSALRSAKSPDGHNDVDGIYLINSQIDRVSVMGLGSRGSIGTKNPSRKSTMRLEGKSPAAQAAEFDALLCHLSKPLGVGFGP
jgi:hypothetical protein